MDIDPKVRDRIIKVLNSQKIAVLGTSKENEPYSCLVSFAFTEDLKTIVFATMRQRLKYENMLANPRVTLIIDNRDVYNSDFNDTTSITVVGTAVDIKGPERSEYASLLIGRHPKLDDFVNAPDCAVIKVEIDRYYVVSEFESVVKFGTK
jgi:nitroimidazol reductase NimA-like FMN-containing flavoprotein (pyridoxamine 5'-phosphate oxidase superfamily)